MKISSYHICIEGAIGVGKTSLAKLIADEMVAKTVLEKFEDGVYIGCGDFCPECQKILPKEFPKLFEITT